MRGDLRAARAVGACNDQDPLDRHDCQSQSGEKLNGLKDEGQEKWGIGGQKYDKSDKPKPVVSSLTVVAVLFFAAVGSSRLIVETLSIIMPYLQLTAHLYLYQAVITVLFSTSYLTLGKIYVFS